MSGLSDHARPRRPYCLRCYEVLAPTREARFVCPRCGHINVKADQRLFWTQEPKLRETEWLAKVGISLLIGLLVASPFLLPDLFTAGVGMGQGYAIGFPLLVGAILWETASKITRTKPYFNATLVWSGLPLVLGLPFALAALWPAEVPHEGRAIGAAGFLLFAVLAYAVRRIGRPLERWKTERILRGQD